MARAISHLRIARFDYSGAGVYGDKDWMAKAKSVTYPPLENPPSPPPFPINQTYERSAVGKVPGREPREFKDISYNKTGFKKLTWIGFSSTATNVHHSIWTILR